MSTEEINAILVDLSALSRLLARASRQVDEIEARLNRAIPDEVRTWAEAETVEFVAMAPPPPAPPPPPPVTDPLEVRVENAA